MYQFIFWLFIILLIIEFLAPFIPFIVGVGVIWFIYRLIKELRRK